MKAEHARLHSGSALFLRDGPEDGQAGSGRLCAGTGFSFGKTSIVLVVVALDQLAVYHLFATARSGHIFAEIRVWAAEVAKQRKRLI